MTLRTLVGALLYAVALGVLFNIAYPTVGITVALGALFALVGIVLSSLTLWAWRIVQGRHNDGGG